MAEQWATAVLWSTTLLFALFSVLAMLDSVPEFRADRDEDRVARWVGNGRAITSKRRLRKSAWFLVGFSCSTLIALLAIAALVFLPNPHPEVELSTSVLRLLLVFMLFAFWRVRRNDRAQRREQDDYKNKVERKMDRIEGLAEETHDTADRIEGKADEMNRKLGDETGGGRVPRGAPEGPDDAEGEDANDV